MLVHLDFSTADRWTVLFGDFEVLHGPVTSAMMTEAGHATLTAQIDGAPVEMTLQARAVAITKFLACTVIRDWRGIADEATGDVPPLTPATIDAVMDIYPVFRAFNEKVIDARVRIDREKKSLPILPNGISATGPDTAPTATDPAPIALDG